MGVFEPSLWNSQLSFSPLISEVSDQRFARANVMNIGKPNQCIVTSKSRTILLPDRLRSRAEDYHKYILIFFCFTGIGGAQRHVGCTTLSLQVMIVYQQVFEIQIVYLSDSCCTSNVQCLGISMLNQTNRKQFGFRHYDDKAAEAQQGFWNCPCVPMRER